MANPFNPNQSHRLIIALQMQEMVAALNTVLRARRLSFILDYTRDHFPRLLIQRPDVVPELIMQLDPRKHVCFLQPPQHRDLVSAFLDLTERLAKHEARLLLVGEKPRQGPRRAMLQLHVSGARTVALTLMDVRKGHILTDTSFTLPDGTTP